MTSMQPLPEDRALLPLHINKATSLKNFLQSPLLVDLRGGLFYGRPLYQLYPNTIYHKELRQTSR